MQACFSATLLQKGKFAVSLASAVSRHLFGAGTTISAQSAAPSIGLHQLGVEWESGVAQSSGASAAPPLPPVARAAPSLLAALYLDGWAGVRGSF